MVGVIFLAVVGPLLLWWLWSGSPLPRRADKVIGYSLIGLAYPFMAVGIIFSWLGLLAIPCIIGYYLLRALL